MVIISGWNDPDLLEVGNNGMTTAEYRSQFAIWSLLKAPLLISTNVVNMSSDTLDILSKREIIAINQDSLVRRELALGYHTYWLVVHFQFQMYLGIN